MSQLLLLTGDQLDHNHPALNVLDKRSDKILMAELMNEATYVKHSKLKIVFILSAMRHFARELQARGFDVIYLTLEETKGEWSDFSHLIQDIVSQQNIIHLHFPEAGEHRLNKEFCQLITGLQVDISHWPASHFIFSKQQMLSWFEGKKAPRMEHFYRWARQQTGLLMTEGKPEGGKFNYDKANRKPYDAAVSIPPRHVFTTDQITQDVIALVESEFSDNPGDLAYFNFAVCREDALVALADFIDNRLAQFGDYQDALSDNNQQLFHSLISAYINVGLLHPMEVCQAAINAYNQQTAPLNAVEGFVRQILGWREYIRGLYWWFGEDYPEQNALNASRPLPHWFWNADTQMRCLNKAIGASLDQAYAHHIQRLMVIGNFSLIAGLDVKAVCQWYLAVYIDAFEWVELPNTLGMALYADGGRLASKPYASSGKYIDKMGDHCRECRYSTSEVTGPKACPYNSLYWSFIARHQQRFASNPRMALMVSQWNKKKPETQAAILQWADKSLSDLDAL